MINVFVKKLRDEQSRKHVLLTALKILIETAQFARYLETDLYNKAQFCVTYYTN